MDPKAALDRVSDLIAEEEYSEARRALADYQQWRERGGFEPPRGDARAREYAKQIRVSTNLRFTDFESMKPHKNPKRRLIRKVGSVNVYRDSDTDEYVARFPGDKTDARDYFTNDLQDALQTAADMHLTSTERRASITKSNPDDRAVVGVKINAGNDRNGNPRRAYLALSRGGVVSVIDDNYGGDATFYSAFPGLHVATTIDTTPAEYRRYLKMGEAIARRVSVKTNPKSLSALQHANRDQRRGWTHVLLAEDSAGNPLVYTGRAGAGWVSNNFAERFPVTQDYAESRAEIFNRNTGIHGLTFRSENVQSAARLFSKTKTNPGNRKSKVRAVAAGLFPVYWRAKSTDGWTLGSVAKTKAHAKQVADALSYRGYYVRVTDGK